MEKITIYHTNDLHSCFDEYLRLCTYTASLNHQTSLILDSGDFNDFRSLLVAGTSGSGGMELLKGNYTDAITIGNNEFFGGKDALQNMLKSFDNVVSCNLFNSDLTNIPNLKDSLIVTKSAIRFLIIGTSPYFADRTFLDLMDLRTEDPTSFINNILEREKGKYDVSILLSHSGYKEDLNLARDTKIDIIAGGHSHTLIEEPENQQGTIIFQSGSHGKYMTKMELLFDEHKQIKSYKHQLLPCPLAMDKRMQEIYDQQYKLGLACYSQVITTLPQDLSYDLYSPCQSMTLLCDVLKKNYVGDFALLNNGILNEGIKKEVSKYSLLMSAPSPLNPTIAPIKGQDILLALQASQDTDLIHSDGKGAGFRGIALGTLSYSSNLQVSFNPFQVTLDQKPLDPKKTYQVITSDYLQRGTGYKMLKVATDRCKFYVEYFRDVLENYFREKDR